MEETFREKERFLPTSDVIFWQAELKVVYVSQLWSFLLRYGNGNSRNHIIGSSI